MIIVSIARVLSSLSLVFYKSSQKIPWKYPNTLIPISDGFYERILRGSAIFSSSMRKSGLIAIMWGFIGWVGNDVERHFEHLVELKCHYKLLLNKEIPILFNSKNMDYAAILSYQTMYFPGPLNNAYSFGLPCPSMTYNFPYYQTSPSFAYCLSNHTGLTQSQVNTPQSIAGEEPTVQPELGSRLGFLRNCRKTKATQDVVKYAKKNAESNVINQIFSYLSIRGKSQRVLSRLLSNSEELIALFYLIMRQLKKNNKKYINRNYIKSLLEMEEDHMIHPILAKHDPKKKLGVELLRSLLRIMVRYYMRNVCINAILTSSKLDRETKNEHLQRRTDVLYFLDYHMKNFRDNK